MNPGSTTIAASNSRPFASCGLSSVIAGPRSSPGAVPQGSSSDRSAASISSRQRAGQITATERPSAAWSAAADTTTAARPAGSTGAITGSAGPSRTVVGGCTLGAAVGSNSAASSKI